MRCTGVQARDVMIEHVREQMKWGIVEVVWTGEDLPDVFPRGALDPGVGDHVLRIVNSEETQTKVACVENCGCQNKQQNDGGI